MKAIVMIGIPGSGKSTIAKKFEPQYIRLSADDIREEMFGDANIQGGKEVWLEFYYRLDQIMASAAFVVIDNTNLRANFRKVLTEKFQNYGYDFEYIVVDTPLEECLRRNNLRDRKVPEEIILSMSKQLQETKPLLEWECRNITYIRNDYEQLVRPELH